MSAVVIIANDLSDGFDLWFDLNQVRRTTCMIRLIRVSEHHSFASALHNAVVELLEVVRPTADDLRNQPKNTVVPARARNNAGWRRYHWFDGHEFYPFPLIVHRNRALDDALCLLELASSQPKLAVKEGAARDRELVEPTVGRDDRHALPAYDAILALLSDGPNAVELFGHQVASWFLASPFSSEHTD